MGGKFRHLSILGTVFVGEICEECDLRAENPLAAFDALDCGGKAIIPTISGRAWITQLTKVVLDPTDPFPEGYRVGDIWG